MQRWISGTNSIINVFHLLQAQFLFGDSEYFWDSLPAEYIVPAQFHARFGVGWQRSKPSISRIWYHQFNARFEVGQQRNTVSHLLAESGTTVLFQVLGWLSAKYAIYQYSRIWCYSLIPGSGFDFRKVCRQPTEYGITVLFQVRGWLSAKYAIYPQNLVLHLDSPTSVERIQVKLNKLYALFVLLTLIQSL